MEKVASLFSMKTSDILRTYCIIMLLMVEEPCKTGFAFSYADDNINRFHTKRSINTANENQNPDPNVALEGQCIVVCDADIVAAKQNTDRQEKDIRRPVINSEGVGSNFWDKMSSSACGGLVSVGRRDRRIAFSVRRSTELTTSASLNGRTTVTFDHVMVNVGDAFDMESSTFVAPINGVYSLSFQVYRLYNKNPLTVELNKNGIPILTGFADGTSDNHRAAHNSGLLTLVARDRITIEVSKGNLESGWKYSTFSGFLVFENGDL